MLMFHLITEMSFLHSLMLPNNVRCRQEDIKYFFKKYPPRKDKSVAKKRKYRKLKEEDKFRSVFVFEDPNI